MRYRYTCLCATAGKPVLGSAETGNGVTEVADSVTLGVRSTTEPIRVISKDYYSKMWVKSKTRLKITREWPQRMTQSGPCSGPRRESKWRSAKDAQWENRTAKAWSGSSTKAVTLDVRLCQTHDFRSSQAVNPGLIVELIHYYKRINEIEF